MTFHRGWSEGSHQGVGVLDIEARDEYDEDEEAWEDDLDEDFDEDSEDWEDDEESDDWEDDEDEDEDWDGYSDDDDDFEAKRGGHLNWD